MIGMRSGFVVLCFLAGASALAAPQSPQAPKTVAPRDPALIDAQGCTMVGLAVSNLDNDRAVQLVLPFDRHSPELDRSLDDVRERFGSKAVTRGVLLHRTTGFTVPLLPD